MNAGPDISVIICTCNRRESMRATLETVIAQEGGVAFEVIAVDNNSTDGTREVIESFAARYPHVSYLFEPGPGLPWARNAGLRLARAPVVVFTDDDVLADPGWIRAVKDAFDHHPEIDYASGRILRAGDPRMPGWLVGNTGPCVLRDRGDEPQFGRPGRFFPGWAGANIAFRREVFGRIGEFATGFPKGQDLEFIIRLWQAGGCGMYEPRMMVRHVLTPDRLEKAYHRMWHTREGDIRARVRYKEIVAADGRVLDRVPDGPRLFGVPAHVYRELLGHAVRWLAATFRFDEAAQFHHESQLRQSVSYIRTRVRESARERTHSSLAELAMFGLALLLRSRRLGS